MPYLNPYLLVPVKVPEAAVMERLELHRRERIVRRQVAHEGRHIGADVGVRRAKMGRIGVAKDVPLAHIGIPTTQKGVVKTDRPRDNPQADPLGGATDLL